MGLLDDAIREHLELMRRRGADPDELARSEDEALGDPRSAGPAAEFAEPPADEPLDVPEFAAAPPEEPVEPPVAVGPEPEAAPPDPPAPRDESAWLEDEPEQDRPAAYAAPHDEPEPEVAGPDEPASDADVLEETPDFLEETPEHDRLWFEQKPPRDFDFDN
jgi:hypothetical protein